MKILLFMLLVFTSLFSKDTIVWMKWDLPPNFIIAGKQKGEGWADKKLKILQDRLPQYEHKSIVVNVNRAISLYKKTDAKEIYCTNDLISHPTLDIDDYMSMASFPFEAHYLVVNKNKAHLFGNEGDTIILKDIIKNPNLKLVVSTNRPYLGAGKVLDEYIKNNPQQNHITFLSTSNIGKSMFGLVAKDRMDYTIEYINKVSYYGNELALLDKVALFKIKENEGMFYDFASCIKTPKGKKVISEVNRILKEQITTDEWMNHFTKWIPTQKLRDEYIKYYKEVFIPSSPIYDTNPRSR